MTWESGNGQDGNGYGIYGQMFRVCDSFESTEPFSQSESDTPGVNIAVIIGAVLGVLAGIACLIGTIGGGVYFWRRRKERMKQMIMHYN